ncbi:uncharacterized protein LOC121736384 isoform X2 [Aricia agestis]|uniref:uncharacterized protein LOC121736384 isoform X1 n=1 Tax=Aricia agestis TaxID=91739 RepID=UPI001C2048AC|nr:uncharacterized protein LOC121736384 isoform X1 [Aricia agestis]XP_041983486.1 uncharacterized protein LOC121736384 isoform X2 [Aricia agestis]
MEFIPDTPYLKVPPDTLQVVRDDIGMGRPGEMKEAVRILDEWVHQQPHFLGKDFPPHYLEMTIVMAKGSLERAKRVIENITTARTLRPEYFLPVDPRVHYEHFKEHFKLLAMPQLTSEYYRIIIVKLTGKVFNEVMAPVYKFAYTCLEYIKSHDYNSGIVLVFDMTDTDLQHFITHVNFFQLRVCLLTFLEAYGMRLKRCHLLTRSKMVHSFISLFRPILSKKIFDRVMANDSGEDLLQYYCKESLPKDYGGTSKSIQELQEIVAYDLCSDEELVLIGKLSAIKMDSTKCTPSQFAEYDDMNGTFRALNID